MSNILVFNDTKKVLTLRTNLKDAKVWKGNILMIQDRGEISPILKTSINQRHKRRKG